MSTVLYKYWIYCVTEGAWKYVYNTEGNPPTTCPTDTAHTVDLNSVYISETITSEASNNIYNSASIGFYNKGLNRLSTVNPSTLFDYKVSGAINTNVWQKVLGVGGTITYQTVDSSINLVAPAGQIVLHQTYRYFPYQPGKIQEIALSGALVVGSPVTNTIYRIGSFDSNVQKSSGVPDRGGDGHFFEYSASNIYVVQRQTNNTGPAYQTDTKIAKENWNIDKLDGTGPSGISKTALELAQTAELFSICREWLGVGAVCFGIEFFGDFVPVHKIENAGVSTYMKTSSLPVRYEVDNTSGGSSATLKQICCSVINWGGYDPRVSNNSFYIDNIAVSGSVDRVFFALQIGSSYTRYIISPLRVAFYSSTLNTTEAVVITILLDPTITSGTMSSYQPIASVDPTITNSAVTISTPTSGTPYVTSGTGSTIYRSFVSSAIPGSVIDGIFNQALTSLINGTTRTMVVTVRTLPGTSVTSGSAMLTWAEEY